MYLLILYNYKNVIQSARVADEEINELFSLNDDNYDDLATFRSRMISPDAEYLQFNITLPEDQKFNDHAPFAFAVKSDNDNAARIGLYNIRKGSKMMRVPVTFGEGTK